MSPPRLDPVESRRRLLIAAVTSIAAGLLPLPIAAATTSEATVGPADWRSVLNAMLPHAGLDPSLYDVTVEALVGAAAKDAAVRQLLDDGWRRLVRECGGDWNAANDAARTRALAALQATPFFALLRRTAAFTFYANPRVWSAFGYEGDAWSFGGYLSRGLDSLDWLPTPPVPRDGA